MIRPAGAMGEILLTLPVSESHWDVLQGNEEGWV